MVSKYLILIKLSQFLNFFIQLRIINLELREMSSKGGKPLTADLVFTKTKSDSLHNIKNLNLWGNDLQDLSLIEKMPNLEVISLSVNRISSLKDFSTCQKLQELYLRKNNISDLRQIRYLVALPSLKVLWLHDNPCAQMNNYREIVVKYLPNLMKLDNNPVTPEERSLSQNVNFSIQVQNQSLIKSEKRTDSTQEKKPRPSSNYYQAPVLSPSPELGNYQSGHRQQKIEKQKLAVRKIGLENAIKKNYEEPKQQQMNRNQNILMAILSLMRELDQGSLEIVRRESEKLLR